MVALSQRVLVTVGGYTRTCVDVGALGYLRRSVSEGSSIKVAKMEFLWGDHDVEVWCLAGVILWADYLFELAEPFLHGSWFGPSESRAAPMLWIVIILLVVTGV